MASTRLQELVRQFQIPKRSRRNKELSKSIRKYTNGLSAVGENKLLKVGKKEHKRGLFTQTSITAGCTRSVGPVSPRSREKKIHGIDR